MVNGNNGDPKQGHPEQIDDSNLPKTLADVPGIVDPTPENTEPQSVVENQTGELTPEKPVASALDTITVKLSGFVSGEKTVPRGTKVSAALSQLTDKPNEVELNDIRGRKVATNRVLKENIELTTVQKASGG